MTTPDPEAAVHRYTATCTWQGSTAKGLEHYDRTHQITSPPAETTLKLTADPTLYGVPGLLNPEQLLLMAAVSCQLLSFLATAAQARVDVVAYEDNAQALMPNQGRDTHITEIHLHPRIVIASDTPDNRIERLVELAHRSCYIANSLRGKVTVEPTIERQ